MSVLQSVHRVRVAGYWPASDPPMPPTLKYLFRQAKMMTGGSIMTTATAMTEPQSVAFCWKKDCRPSGRVNAVAGAQEHDGDQVVVPGHQEREDRRGQDAGQGVAQHDLHEAAEQRSAVDPGRLLEGDRDGVQVGGHHPGRDRHGGADVDDHQAAPGCRPGRGSRTG